VEHLVYDGQGGNDALTVVTPAGQQMIAVDPGVLPDEGTVSIQQSLTLGGSPLLGVSFTHLGAAGSLSFADAAVPAVPADVLTINGRDLANGSDIFRVLASGDVHLGEGESGASLVTVHTPGVAALHLNGLAGDDVFFVPGSHPFPGLGGG